MNLLAVGTPSSIYHGFYTQRMFWEEIFTRVNMENYGRCNVRKHWEIKNGEQYITLDISLDFVSMEKTKMKSSEAKIISEDQKRDWLPLWVSRPSEGLKKRQGMPLLMSVWRIFLILLRNVRVFLMGVMCVRVPNMNLQTVTFIYKDILRSVWWEPIHTLAL